MNKFKAENFVLDKVQVVSGHFLGCLNCGWFNISDSKIDCCPECGTDLTIKYTKIIEEQ